MVSGARSILHVDMDAFYASVEQRDDPSLRGKPVVVGGYTRGVVAAASYEARRYGIHSAMPMREALARCPDLCRIPPRMAYYQEVSRQVFDVFRRFTPLVEGLSLDEAFLDVTSSLQLFGDDVAIARQVKDEIRAATGLTASVGVAPNKLVAKIASDLEKPDGLCIITESSLRERLDPLPVGVIPGIGRETRRRLQPLGIETVGDLRKAPDHVLEAVFGRFARRTRDRARGIDGRPVVAIRRDKSISAEETFATDLGRRSDLCRELLSLSDRTSARLRAKQLVAGTIQVKIRRADFSTFTRQCLLKPPTSNTGSVYRVACQLLDEWLAEHPGARVRLLGVGGSDLSKDAQPDLFAASDPGSNSGVDTAVDEVRSRFGTASLGRARALKPGQIG